MPMRQFQKLSKDNDKLKKDFKKVLSVSCDV